MWTSSLWSTEIRALLSHSAHLLILDQVCQTCTAVHNPQPWPQISGWCERWRRSAEWRRLSVREELQQQFFLIHFPHLVPGHLLHHNQAGRDGVRSHVLSVGKKSTTNTNRLLSLSLYGIFYSQNLIIPILYIKSFWATQYKTLHCKSITATHRVCSMICLHPPQLWS